MSYPTDVLSTRAVVKPGLYAIIPQAGLVHNVIPAIQNCRVSIVASPKMGASFVQYVVAAEPGACSTAPLAGEAGIESFLYVIEGTVQCCAAEKEYTLSAGGYIFSPADSGGIEFSCAGPARFLFYKQRYIPLADVTAYPYTGNVQQMPYLQYDGMENVFIKDLLPKDLGFDMNMHILSFLPGACHGFVETHVQEHGAYILSGAGMYIMENTWMPIKKDDFMWFGPYVPQGAYGVGREPFAYIYSKDCNRDVML